MLHWIKLKTLHPDRLTRWLGRLLCPCLLVLILILFGGCLLHPLAAQYAAPTEAYRSAVVLQGVLYGYQTMDALAALNFGAVIAMNIRAQGVAREQDVQRSAIRAGLVAGGLLLVVYTMLGHAGALTGAAVPGLATGAEVLTVLAERLFGKAGLVLYQRRYFGAVIAMPARRLGADHGRSYAGRVGWWLSARRMNIRAQGVARPAAQCHPAGLVAEVLVVYTMLGHAGAMSPACHRCQVYRAGRAAVRWGWYSLLPSLCWPASTPV